MAKANLDSEFAATEREILAAQSAAQDWLARLHAGDQSHIARLIITAFVGLICLVVVAVILGFFHYDDWNKISEPSKFLVGILSSVLLPVVTLVIGHYFGRK